MIKTGQIYQHKNNSTFKIKIEKESSIPGYWYIIMGDISHDTLVRDCVITNNYLLSNDVQIDLSSCYKCKQEIKERFLFSSSYIGCHC